MHHWTDLTESFLKMYGMVLLLVCSEKQVKSYSRFSTGLADYMYFIEDFMNVCTCKNSPMNTVENLM